ncbi:PH domain-containing protein [Adhaeribacter radiodurans]|uniref:PH domain-containing protein n=1 Tax=Adhaeribacter radiodurans TaxID=2745197 RepID=A0A7L7L7T3_9BACT|nr:PH domain-containing protein [Adhaeribacter radiodurans]QMU28886.1 PH domain-containing protein [Adhaeribacter radiodurans]
MGILDGLMGNASEVSLETIQTEFAPLLVDGENLEKAFKILRDMLVFTNKRLLIVDKQGLTGSKIEYLSIPYKSITRFSKESGGMFDLDAELNIWVTGQAEPIKKEFRKDNNINQVYQLLSTFILK